MTDPGVSYDHVEYVRALILARCPELSVDDLAALVDADLATLDDAASAEDEMVPIAVVDQILDVIVGIEERMTTLEQAAQRSDADPVAACRRAMLDFDIETKRLVMTELDRWVSLEEASHESLQ